ncbi:MAG TPA: 5-guanidino-2-oxopentanoate decarboxylase [Steroidobacteraceae bacterium]|jgi:thiamine pyrophosphate-dependent acetolactate synthase large subunit-like protein|nr:5-guanidino-2-oxopentanoate decarboxylase [Steroidobacteraceae bacterium]
MSAPPWTVGRYVVETLAANGIDTVFGIPGVHNIELYRGLELARVRHVLVRHEQSAAFAADGYARASRHPAAAFVISGPGATNALTALAQAYSDSVPLLLIASTPARATLGQGWGVLHELADQRSLVASVTAFAGSARSDMQLRDHLRAAFAALHGPRPRPAYVDIPLDLLGEPTALRPETFARTTPVLTPPREAIEAARALLASAARPLIIAGGGACAAGAALRQLVEALDGYVVTTVAGKGIVAESHPASLGASLPFAATQERVAAADVVIAAGTELSETDVYTTTRLPMNGRLVRIDVDEHKLADHYAAGVAVHGDAALSLGLLARGTSERRGWRSAAGSGVAHRERIDAQLDGSARLALSALHALRAALPADGVIFSDMTQIAYLGNYAFAAERPGVWFHPSGYGALGFAVPAALGARIAQPQRPIVALAGDFGVQFTLQELLTATELDVTLPIVVWNNGALGQIRDDMCAAGITPIGVVARNPDFVALAHACGATGVRVHGATALAEALHAALARPGPTLIEAPTAEFRPS